MVIVMIIVWLLGPSDAKADLRTPYVSSNWENQFQLNDKDPYGLYLFDQLLHAHLDSNSTIQPITDWIVLDSVLQNKNKATMVFVGNKFGLQNREIDTILGCVKKGSTLFISYNELTDNLIQRFFTSYGEGYDYADSVNTFINRNRFSMYYLFQNDTIAHEWDAFYKIQPIDSNYISLSSFMEMSNFIRIKLGNGWILLHTNPEFFFNYQLKRNEGYRYSSFVLNQLSKTEDIYLLEMGRLLDKNEQSGVDDSEEKGDVEDSSYLKFLLKNPAFSVAMGLILLGIVLFILFRAKRIQPIVPFIPKKKNMSLEFAETITSIYLSKQHPIGILRVQRKNFYDAVNKHFFIDISRRSEDRDREIRILSEKSTIGEAEIREILGLFEPNAKSLINDNYIIDVAKRQKAFYLKTGMISSKIIQKIEHEKVIIQRNLFLSFILIFGGIITVVFGMYYLVLSIGVGIILWPIGGILLFIGIRRLSHPLLKIENDSISFYSIFIKKVCLQKDLLHVKRLKNGYQLMFTGNREFFINNMELSRFDKTQFERFIAKYHQIEL